MRQNGGGEHSTNSVLLNGLSREQLIDVLAKCSRKCFAKDTQIVRELDEDNNLYLIESGVLGVAQFSSSGKEVGYTELKPGENFGELSAIDGKPRSASVTALTDSEVTVMPFSVFKSLMESGSPASIEIMRQLTAMVRRLCDRIYEFTTLSVSNRIHAETLRLARKHLDLDGMARIAAPPTHAQLASRVSCNREAVSRELKQMENTGIIVKQGRRWIIPAIDDLQKMVDEVHKF
jgi:CRP-like cAMP-binding protein